MLATGNFSKPFTNINQVCQTWPGKQLYSLASSTPTTIIAITTTSNVTTTKYFSPNYQSLLSCVPLNLQCAAGKVIAWHRRGDHEIGSYVASNLTH